MRAISCWLAAAVVVLAACGSQPGASHIPSPTLAGATQTPPTDVASSERSGPPTGGQPTAEPAASTARTAPPAGPRVPEGRGAAQLAYDAARHFAVLFGGQDAYGPTADTWTWDGRQWTQVTGSVVSPSPRQGGAFIYDPVRHVSVLFGGAAYGGWDDVLGDTWTFDGRQWTQQAPATSPSKRAFSAVTFDTHRGVVVLAGGWIGNGGIGDVWTWDGTTWTQQAAPGLPAMYPLGLTYRAQDDSLMLAGQPAGGSGIGGGMAAWIYSSGSWKTTGGTGSCLDHYGGSAGDAQHGTLVFFGGYCSNATVVWNGSAWSETTPNPSPDARGNEAGRPAMTFDPDLSAVLLFGGVANGTYFNDLWAWDGSVWKRLG